MFRTLKIDSILPTPCEPIFDTDALQIGTIPFSNIFNVKFLVSIVVNPSFLYSGNTSIPTSQISSFILSAPATPITFPSLNAQYAISDTHLPFSKVIIFL